MAVCYFNKDYTNRYRCEYEKKENEIIVNVEYDIQDEEKVGTNGGYSIRDILIIDDKNKINYLLKKSYYSKYYSSFGNPDGTSITSFNSSIYFVDNDYKKIADLPQTPKAKKIKIYSNLVNEFIGCPSLSTISNDEDHIIKLKKESQKNTVEINKNYIKNLTIGDEWTSVHSPKKYNIDINLTGYIEIELTRRVNYDNVYDFTRELIIFIQLLIPNKLIINKIKIMVDNKYYELFLPLAKLVYKEKYVESSVSEDLIDFLKKCYSLIPYRNSKTEIRNIPYIILNTSRNIEDNFLMFYRFIECYYKKQQIQNIRKTFVSCSIKNNYKNSKNMTEDEIEKLSQEIICLRNHYVHSGYYLKNESIKISFDRIKRKKNPKDYTVNNADFDWIYERTKILYKIVIDIIFSNMLGYKYYKFNKHF